MRKSLLFKVKRTLFACFLLSAVTGFCGSCNDSSSDSDDSPTTVKRLNAGPAMLKFDADGTACQLTVNAENVEWTATAANTWVHLSVASGNADAVIQVTLDANESEQVLTSSIVVSAEGVEPVTILVEQSAKEGEDPNPDPDPEPEPDIDITLKMAEGYWAGDYWGTGGVLNDIYLVMTDMDISDNKLVPPGYVISLDLNIPAATFSTFDIVGTYTPSVALTPTQKFTFNTDEVTYVQVYDAAGNRQQKYTTAGRVEITRSGSDYSLEMTFTLDDKSILHAVYNGKISFYDDTRKYLSTLTSDYTPSLVGGIGTIQPYSAPDVPASLCVLSLNGDNTQPIYDNMQLLLNVDPATEKTGAIEGEYTLLSDMSMDAEPGTAIPGYLTQEGRLMGCWYYKLAQLDGASQLAGMAPCMSGKITITRENKEYTLVYSFIDDNTATPHKISGTFKGVIEFDIEDPDPNPGQDGITASGNLGQWKPGGRW